MREGLPQIALSFVYDGTFIKTWDFICEIFPELLPIIEHPSFNNLDKILEELQPKGRVVEEDISLIDLYRRVYSTYV